MSNIPLNVNTVNWDVAASRVFSRANQNMIIDISGNSNNITFKNGNQNLLIVNNYDCSFNGNIVYFGNSTSTSSGRVYYYDSSKNWNLANTTNAGQKLIGIAIGSSLTANGMLLSGQMKNSLYSSFTIGSNVYLSDVSGVLTTTQSTRPLGFVIDAWSILISPYSLSSTMSGISGYGIATGAATTGFTSSTITDPSSSLQYTLLKWTDYSTTQNNTMTVSTAGLFEVFLLGGGGGSGNTGNSGSCGGGGAGELLKQTVYLNTGSYTAVVGRGGQRSAANSTSGVRGYSSSLAPTTPNFPKLVASGGGGGMNSNNSTTGPNSNSYWKQIIYSEGVCSGGGASPYNDNGVIQYVNVGVSDIISLQGFGQNPSSGNVGGITTGNFSGGKGYNDSNYSATGGGGGLAGNGGDTTVVGGATMRGGRSGKGIIDGFSGINLGYGGGGGGGHATIQAAQLQDTDGTNVMCYLQGYSVAGTTLTVTNVAEGTISLYMRICGYIVNWTGTEAVTEPTGEIYISAFGTGSGGNGTYTLSSTILGNISGATTNILYLSLYGGGMGCRTIAGGGAPQWISGGYGSPNSGGGGGSGANQNFTSGQGGSGGSGIVMVRFRS